MATKTSRFDRSLVEGPIGAAVWKLAWPSVLQNMIGGMQGVVDHALVGHLVGFAGNAGIGVAFQIFLVVMVFMASIFTGMGVLISRYTGANNEEAVNRTAVQAFITAVALCLGFLAPVGYFLAPHLLGLVNAAPAVQAQALPFLRIMFVFGIGMMLFFMLGGALRSAGDARTPLKLGVGLTALNIALNVILIRGLGPIPAFGTKGAAMGTVIASAVVSLYALIKLFSGRWVINFRGPELEARLGDHQVALPFRAPHRAAGRRDERCRGDAAPLPGLRGAERRGAGGLRRGLHRALLAGHLDLGRADGCHRGPRRAEPRRRPSGAQHPRGPGPPRSTASRSRRSSGCSFSSCRTRCSASSA